MTLITEVLNAWDKSGIEWCHWKSTNHLAETFLAVTDVDILVSPSDRFGCEQILSTFKFIEMDTAHLRSYPAIKDYISYDEDLGFVHFHLHYQLNLGDRWSKNYHFPFEHEILKNRVIDRNFETFTVNPLDELYMFTLRMLLKYRKPEVLVSVNDEYVFLQKRISDFNGDLQPGCKYLGEIHNDCGEYLFSDINVFFSKVRSRHLKDFINNFRRYSYRRYTVNILKRAVYRYYVEFRRRKLNLKNIGRRRIRSGGKIAVFIGGDGSGKTSRIRSLHHIFSQQVNVSSVFLGNGESGSGLARKMIFKLYGKKRFQSKGHKLTKEAGFWKRILIVSWNLIGLIEREKRFKNIVRERGAGSLIFVDRWPTLNGQITDGPRLSNLQGRNFFECYVQKRELEFFRKVELLRPDLVFKLTAPPEVALQRKPGEFSREYIENCNSEIHLRKIKAQRVVEIRTNRPEDSLDLEMSKIIWDLLCK